MDLNYLKTFKTIIEEGSFTKAASKLNYTQATITFQIKQLEKTLHFPLFEKIGRNMVLTTAGKQLIPYVDDVLCAINKIHYFNKDLHQFHGDLTVGIAESYLCYKLPYLLNKFHQYAPNAHLFLRSMNCYDIQNELLKGKLDLGILYQDIENFSPSLTKIYLDIYDLALIISPSLNKSELNFCLSNQNINLPFIINEQKCIFRQIFEQYLIEKNIHLGHTIELWSIPTIKNLVMNNMGISFLPKFTVENELNNNLLIELPTLINKNCITAVCAHHKNKWISPLMQLFIDLCTKKLL